jgi:hypothetical protein
MTEYVRDSIAAAQQSYDYAQARWNEGHRHGWMFGFAIGFILGACSMAIAISVLTTRHFRQLH